MNITILKKIGFTNGEIMVFLALLELGETTTGPIINKSHISSSKVYEILYKLIEKGLVSCIYKDKIKYFQPSSPKMLIDYFKKEKMIFEESEKALQDIIPQLEQKYKTSEESQTSSVYEGFAGIKTALSQMLDKMEKKEEYYVFTVDEEITSKELRLFFLNYHTKRIEKRIQVKLLSNKRYKKEILKLYPKYKLSERRFIDHAFPTGIFIYKDHIMQFIYAPKPTVFVIKSKQAYESYKKFFLEMWNKAK